MLVSVGIITTHLIIVIFLAPVSVRCPLHRCVMFNFNLISVICWDQTSMSTLTWKHQWHLKNHSGLLWSDGNIITGRQCEYSSSLPSTTAGTINPLVKVYLVTKWRYFSSNIFRILGRLSFLLGHGNRLKIRIRIRRLQLWGITADTFPCILTFHSRADQ